MEFCLLINLPWEFYSFVKYFVMDVLHELPAKSQKGLFKHFSLIIFYLIIFPINPSRENSENIDRQVHTRSIFFRSLRHSHLNIIILRNEYERKISHTKNSAIKAIICRVFEHYLIENWTFSFPNWFNRWKFVACHKKTQKGNKISL